jgi:predicted DNA-binding transcriptional regulator YafY
VGIRTIQRDLLTLQSDLGIPIAAKGNDRYGIIEGYILPPVSFSLYEATALFLASRLVMRQMDRSNPYFQTALVKMGRTLPAGAKAHVTESAHMISKKSADPDYIRIFEQITLAWSTQRKLRIWYQSLHSSQVREWLLEPYFVDMTGVGFSMYVIGRARHEDREGIITFKLDRIKEAEVLEENFEIPSDARLDDLVESSWGIMQGDDSQVVLRFSPQVVRRVKESTWHPSQVIEDLPDGGCLMTLSVAGTLEITPWIRGWGPDVEVLEPEALRQQFAQYTRHLWGIYERPKDV